MNVLFIMADQLHWDHLMARRVTDRLAQVVKASGFRAD
jgi:hypothetical protein